MTFFFVCLVREPRSWCYGRTTAVRLFVQPLWWRWAVFLPSFTSNGAPVEWNWQGKTDNSEKNLSQCHFVHHKSHMDLTWDRTRASVVRGRLLTAWAMARPITYIRHLYRQTLWYLYRTFSWSQKIVFRVYICRITILYNQEKCTVQIS
jgi:hypothetical protein